MKITTSFLIQALLLCGRLVTTSSAFAPGVVTRVAPTSSVVAGSALPMKSSSTQDSKESISAKWDDLFVSKLPKLMTAGMIAASALLGPINLPTTDFVPPVASAAESRIVGELKGSGLVFKDTLEIESFEDPKVKGVTLYISNFQRPLTERLQKDFFSDPSSAAVGCAKTGPIQIANNIAKGKEGEEVFKESKSLLFKSLRVQRIFDEEKNTVVYVSFNTRLDKNDDSNKSRFKSSLCAVNLDDYSAPPPAATATAAATEPVAQTATVTP